MSHSPVDQLADATLAAVFPILDSEEEEEEVAKHDNDLNLLTIRRRCELCKQRKVRSTTNPASLELAYFVMTSWLLDPIHYFSSQTSRIWLGPSLPFTSSNDPR